MKVLKVDPNNRKKHTIHNISKSRNVTVKKTKKADIDTISFVGMLQQFSKSQFVKNIAIRENGSSFFGTISDIFSVLRHEPNIENSKSRQTNKWTNKGSANSMDKPGQEGQNTIPRPGLPTAHPAPPP